MDPAIALQEFIDYVVGQLIRNPDRATISHEQSADGTRHSFTLALAPEDVGRIIGKHGQTISSIRSLLDAAATRNGVEATLKVDGDDKDYRRRRDA